MSAAYFAIVTDLGPDDLCDVLNAIFTGRDKWYHIGLQLKIPFQTLNVIRREHRDNATDCLTEMLQKWLTSTSPPPTWSGLVQALSSAPVGEKRLAEDIRRQHCLQDGEQATGPAPGEVKAETADHVHRYKTFGSVHVWA